MTEPERLRIALCRSADLVEGALAVPFDIIFNGQTCRAFAVRYQGQPHAYLNRCGHIAMELDWQPGHVFDAKGQHLVCATHGALYAPDTGKCLGQPCRKSLQKITCSENSDTVFWHTDWNVQPLFL